MDAPTLRELKIGEMKMRKVLLLCVLLCCATTACKTTSQKQTTKLEWKFMEKMSVDTATDLAEYVTSNCPCEDGHFASKKCHDQAERALVTIHRMPWHIAMARYLRGEIEVRPAKVPPVIPATDSLCAEGGVE